MQQAMSCDPPPPPAGPPDPALGGVLDVRRIVVEPAAAAEVVFLTHDDGLHEVDLGWHPKAGEVPWRPELQQPERSQTGGWNVRYRDCLQGDAVHALTDLVAERTQWLRTRHGF